MSLYSVSTVVRMCDRRSACSVTPISTASPRKANTPYSRPIFSMPVGLLILTSRFARKANRSTEWEN